MKKLALAAIGVLLLAPVVAFSSGGWALVKVSKIPDAWVVGRPLQLSFKVLQHGVSPMTDLKPVVEARSGARVVRGATMAFAEDGETGYRSRITFPERGDWQVTIHSGFGDSKTVLLPWSVVDSVTPIRGTVEEHLASRGTARFSEAERGRRLFASQGCVGCHTHRAVGVPAGIASGFGGDLSERRFPADYLAKFLADPSIRPVANGKRMPNMGLREKEILPLVAFINSGR